MRTNQITRNKQLLCMQNMLSFLGLQFASAMYAQRLWEVKRFLKKAYLPGAENTLIIKGVSPKWDLVIALWMRLTFAD